MMVDWMVAIGFGGGSGEAKKSKINQNSTEMVARTAGERYRAWDQRTRQLMSGTARVKRTRRHLLASSGVADAGGE